VLNFFENEMDTLVGEIVFYMQGIFFFLEFFFFNKYSPKTAKNYVCKVDVSTNLG